MFARERCGIRSFASGKIAVEDTLNGLAQQGCSEIKRRWSGVLDACYVRLTLGLRHCSVVFMDVTFQIPDDLANRVTATGDLSRRALEAFTLEELRAGRITEVELRKMLGLERIELDGFLKTHGIYQDYTLGDFEEERRALKELGL